jgi:MFS family permease
MAAHDHGRGAISGVIMAHTLGMFGLAWLTGWLIDRLGRVRMIVVGGLVLILSCIVAPISTATPMLALSLFLLGLGWNFTYVAGSSLLSDQLRPVERGRMQGASEMVVALASGAGSLSTGIIFATGGYLLAAAIGLAFSVLIVIGGIAVPARHRPAFAASSESTS